MDDPDPDDYAPRSPDLTTYYSSNTPSHGVPFTQPMQGQPYDQRSHYYHPQLKGSLPSTSSSNQHHIGEEESTNTVMQDNTTRRLRTRGKPVKHESEDVSEEPEIAQKSTTPLAIVKTKFPAARIKRIMQSDEEVGKVSQVVPGMVGKALELFMISIVTKSAEEAQSKHSKRITQQHLKAVVNQNEVYDFLTDIVNKIPDAPTKETGDEEGEGKKRRAGANASSSRKKRKDSSDEI